MLCVPPYKVAQPSKTNHTLSSSLFSKNTQNNQSTSLSIGQIIKHRLKTKHLSSKRQLESKFEQPLWSILKRPKPHQPLTTKLNENNNNQSFRKNQSTEAPKNWYDHLQLPVSKAISPLTHAVWLTF